jgi:ABC-type glycerol-3-phosphate transport system substrate-binding protein
MKPTSLSLLMGSITLLLAACSSGEPAAQSSTSASPVAAVSTQSAGQAQPSKGGQVVESGKYHLELVPEKSAKETHLDLYVQSGDNHQSIANATVSGQLQSPDGQQTAITFTYDASGKHYAATAPAKAGTYQLKVAATIGSEKADGRFEFNR